MCEEKNFSEIDTLLIDLISNKYCIVDDAITIITVCSKHRNNIQMFEQFCDYVVDFTNRLYSEEQAKELLIPIAIIVGGADTLICPHCGKSDIKTKQGLTMHKNQCTKKPKEQENRNPLQCKCGRILKSKSGFTLHTQVCKKEKSNTGGPSKVDLPLL